MGDGEQVPQNSGWGMPIQLSPRIITGSVLDQTSNNNINNYLIAIVQCGD